MAGRVVTRREEAVVRTHVHADRVALGELATDDEVGHRVHHLALDEALERTRAVDGVEPVEGERLLGRGRKPELDAVAAEAVAHVAELDVHDFLDVLETEGVEDRHVVDTVQELRLESLAQGVVDLALDLVRVARRVGASDELAAHVGRHDDDRVLEAHHAPLAVGEAVIQDLQQDVEDVRVRLLHLVEQDDLGTKYNQTEADAAKEYFKWVLAQQK